MQKKNIHKTAIALLVFANVFVITLFLDVSIMKNVNTSGSFLNQFGNVIGVSAGVAPNEVNIVAQELSEWEKNLDSREKTLNEREVLLSESGASTNKTSIIYITAIGFLLLILVVMNFVLDWRRSQEKNNLLNRR